MKGNHFYVVDTGTLDVFVKGDASDEAPQKVKEFKSGESFGELALMYNCPRTATIQAPTDALHACTHAGRQAGRQAGRRHVTSPAHVDDPGGD